MSYSQVSDSIIQSCVTKCSPLLKDRQVVNCVSFISKFTSQYKAKFYSSWDKIITFRLYDSNKRIRYLTFEFNSHLVTIKYGTKRSTQNIKTYLAV